MKQERVLRLRDADQRIHVITHQAGNAEPYLYKAFGGGLSLDEFSYRTLRHALAALLAMASGDVSPSN